MHVNKPLTPPLNINMANMELFLILSLLKLHFLDGRVQVNPK